jgi:hypothetical protein
MSALWPVAIVSTESKGKTDRNDWNTACGNFKTPISSGHHYKNGAYIFLLPKNNSCFLQFCYLVAISTGSKSQLFQQWREWELQDKWEIGCLFCNELFFFSN